MSAEHALIGILIVAVIIICFRLKDEKNRLKKKLEEKETEYEKIKRFLSKMIGAYGWSFFKKGDEIMSLLKNIIKEGESHEIDTINIVPLLKDHPLHFKVEKITYNVKDNFNVTLTGPENILVNLNIYFSDTGGGYCLEFLDTK